MDRQNSHSLAADITKSASKQTYYTIRFFVDRSLVADAYRAYGYYRWVDDTIDMQTDTKASHNNLDFTVKSAFVNRQKDLLEACYRGEVPDSLCPQELMLVDLVCSNEGKHPGLKSYLHNMMSVMSFDAERRGRAVSQTELDEYSHALATAVTDAMFYFIGHDDPPPPHKARYLPVTAAHITHMLRDTKEDIDAGYFNIPGEFLQSHDITPGDVKSQAYRKWVCSRVKLAGRYFDEGRVYLSRVKNLRCRIAGFAYTARFEWMLRAIERDNFCLRSEYRHRKSFSAGLWMVWTTLTSIFASNLTKRQAHTLAFQPAEIDER